jgi:hypothetical protein
MDDSPLEQPHNLRLGRRRLLERFLVCTSKRPKRGDVFQAPIRE